MRSVGDVVVDPTKMHVERRQLSGAREWIDDAPRVSAAVLAELRRAWAGAEDAAESEHTSVRSVNLDSALRASTSALRASKKYHGRRPSRVKRRGPGGVARVGGR